MSLQRMIVMPPDTFERWKKIIVEDKKLSDLDREMKKVLYNNKINDINKWHLYRQNLLKYLNTKQKHNNVRTHTKYTNYNHKTSQTLLPNNIGIGIQATPENSDDKSTLINVDVKPKTKKYRHKTIQTLPPHNRSIRTQTTIMPQVKEIPPIEEVFTNSSRFSNLEDESGNIATDGTSGEQIELDVDDIVRERALEGQPAFVKISKERLSFDPKEYRLFELNTGETVNVPVEHQMITRATKKRVANSDSSQTLLDFRHRKRKKPKRSEKEINQTITSTPKKIRAASGIPWKSYK